jgi:hypothetical protein
MMMRLHLAIITFFAFILSQTRVASSTTSEGFELSKRAKKISKINYLPLQDHYVNLRQWNEDEYESLMNGLSGQSNLRHRHMQQQYGNNESQEFYLPENRIASWQIVALVISVTGTIVFAYYAYTLRHELSTLNQYLPLGYRLFPNRDSEEDDKQVEGVEMS